MTQEKGKGAKLLEILKVSTVLGLTSFGGPIAHLGYFHLEYVKKRKWIDEHSYADLVALCQFLPGPASSQVGIGIGVMRGGVLGGLAAWAGFTLPSAIALVLFATLLKEGGLGAASWVHGLKVVAVAIVAHSVLAMGRKLASEKRTATIAVAAAAAVLLWQTAFTQILVILGAGLLGMRLFRDDDRQKEKAPMEPAGLLPAVFLSLFAALLLGLPVLAHLTGSPLLKLFDSFYRSGALVFGGGHVVLPLLEMEVVPSGLVSQADFLTGYGAVQAVPGPLFTFAAYLGALAAGLPGAAVALGGIFAPAFLLVVGVIPYWNRLRANTRVKAGLVAVNAAVVGILLAALYNPLWTTAVRSAEDFILAMVLFLMLAYWRVPPLAVVLTGALGGLLIGLV